MSVVDRILVIDDREIDCYIAHHFIRKQNFAKEIIVKNSADEALDFLKSVADPAMVPDVILVDIRMPGKDGFDFVKEYSLLPRSVQDRSTIVMYSSSSLPEDLNRVKQYPAIRHFFTKPITPAKLDEVATLIKAH